MGHAAPSQHHRWAFLVDDGGAAARSERRAPASAGADSRRGSTERRSTPRSTPHSEPNASDHAEVPRRVYGAERPPRSAAERQYEREHEHEARTQERRAERRHERREAREWADEHAPRATGREAVVERRRERAAQHRSFAERNQVDDDVTDALSEETIMGYGDSFRAALAARDRASTHATERRAVRGEDLAARREAQRSKEQATMSMFHQMARERFG